MISQDEIQSDVSKKILKRVNKVNDAAIKYKEDFFVKPTPKELAEYLGVTETYILDTVQMSGYEITEIDFEPEKDYVKYEDLKAIDKFALHKLNQLIETVTVAFDNYEFYKYFQHLQNFAAVDLSSFYLDIVKDRLYTAGKKSLSRRACQTVLYETLQTLVRVLVPVMPHQAEDIWMSIPQCQKSVESALLTNWPKVHSEWNNAKLEEDFTKILKTREVVSRAIEPLRAEKQVGSSLEVAVYVSLKDNEVLKTNEKDLADIFIVSQAYVTDEKPSDVMNEYKEDNYTVWVTKAHGEKCSRCWKYRPLNDDGICEDCIDAIK